MTPEQMSLLSQPNSDQYPSEQELLSVKISNSSETSKEKGRNFSLREDESESRVYSDKAGVPTQEKLGMVCLRM